MPKTVREITITCPHCGQEHRLVLDASGHYAGPSPCDGTRHVDLQIDPEEWRALVESSQAAQVH